MAGSSLGAPRRLTLGTCIGIASGIGAVGGTLVGITESIQIVIGSLPRPHPILNMLWFSLSMGALYGFTGCLVMTGFGAASNLAMRLGKYSISKSRLAGLYVGIFAMLIISLELSNIMKPLMLPTIRQGKITDADILTILEVFSISVLCGIALGGLTSWILESRIKRQRLIAVSVSVFIAFVTFLNGITWINFALPQGPLSTISISCDLGLLILTPFLGLGVYLVTLSLLEGITVNIKRGLVGICLTGGVVGLFMLGGLIIYLSTKDRSEQLQKVQGTKPNILWIVIDSLRADHLSCYRYHRNTTPNIDRIAAEGLLFENAFTTAPWSLPSCASMLTGLYPSRHGADAQHYYLEDRFDTIAEVLSRNGYRTFGCVSENMWCSHKTNLDQGFETFASRVGRELPLSKSTIIDMVNSITGGIRSKARIAKATNRILKGWIADSVQAKTPFFIFAIYLDAHFPFLPPQPYRNLWLDRGTDIPQRIRRALLVPYPYEYLRDQLKIGDQGLRIIKALYDGCISYVDFKVGQIYRYLSKLGVLDNTILVITADHGENFGDHKLMQHYFHINDALLRVPLIIRYPKRFKGLRIKKLVQTVDIFPTLLDLVGIEHPEDLQGYSMLGDQTREFIIAEHVIFHIGISGIPRLDPSLYRLDTLKYGRRLRAIRTDKYKYVWASDGKDELYNIQNDPKELTNLIEIFPEKARYLETLLKVWLGSFEHYRPQTGQRDNVLR
jgi:arylsulfatase A-like enzyme